MKFVAPSIHETAFNCPHCGALTTQTWYRLLADPRSDENPMPPFWTKEDAEKKKFDDIKEVEVRDSLKSLVMALASGIPQFQGLEEWASARKEILSLNISSCYNCKSLSVWIHEALVYPSTGEAQQPNPDLSEEIRRDYLEASSIASKSPRGAAALLRLSIQKLCVELGEKGKNINDDIASLVKKGLDARIQQALDVVRVIGNESVHPGEIDIRDDFRTVSSLFQLVNIIAEKMISEPKRVSEMFNSLPKSKLKAIHDRDKK